MKAQILKIAGVKSEKEFYKKYKTEADFMKVHGKEFKKAQMGVEIEKAQNGLMQGPEQAPSNNYYQNNNPFFTTNPGATGLNNPAVAAPQTGGGMAGAMPYMQAGMDVVQGLSMIPGQKNRVEKAKSEAGITNVQALADESRDVDTRRQQQDYFGRKRNALMRPINGEELFPVDGVGTNVLARNGVRLQDGGGIGGNPTKIQNTYAPEYDLYEDIEFEPLNDSRQVKQFQFSGSMFPTGMTSQQGNISQYGDMATNLSNRFINQGGQEDAGSMIGGGIFEAAGTAIGGPLVGKLTKPVGKLVGGLIDTSDKKIAGFEKQTNKNIGRVTGQAFAQNLQQQNQSYMEDGGYVNPEYNPQLITMFGDHDASDFADYANKFRAGGHLKSYTAPSERAMETYEEGGDIQSYALGGELKIDNRGDIDFMGYNPITAQTGASGYIGITKGPSHDNGGFNVDYNGSKVEVEGNETVVERKDGGSIDDTALNILGDMYIGKQGKNILADINEKTANKILKGRNIENIKFKHLGNDIAKKTKNLNNLENTYTELANSSKDKLKQKTAEAGLTGIKMQYKDLHNFQDNLVKLQSSYHDTAKEFGYEDTPKFLEDIKKEKVMFKENKNDQEEYAEYGTTIPKAQTGITTDDKGKKITKAERERLIKSGEYKVDPSNPKKIYRVKSKAATSEEKKSASAMDTIPKQSKDTKTGLFGGVTPEQFEEYKKKNSWFPNWDTFDPNDENDVDQYAKMYNAEAEKRGSTARILSDEIDPKTKKPKVGGKTKFVGKQVTSALLDDIKKETPASVESEYLEVEDETAPTEPIPYKRNVLMDIYNQALPYIRKMPDEQLDPRQLYGEMYGLSNNQLEPVDAQFYRPQLDVPYDISLQDQRNEVTAQTRAAQRMAGYNPSAQAQIASQAYEPLNKITGEEFRLNQAKKDQVYSGNRATLNDAQLKNLGIADQQYQRQSQAKSNTITQAALQSIGDKYVQNALENRKERIQSNLYPQYSFDSEGRAINTGQLTQFNIPTVGGVKGTQRQVPVYKADGKTIDRYQLEEYDPSADGGVGTPPINSKGKNGKSIASRNGSIVKSYKNI